MNIDIAICESLTLDQKLYFLTLLLEDVEPEFYLYIRDNFDAVVSKIQSLDSFESIRLYIEILQSKYYKN